jgi:hypothetical protein
MKSRILSILLLLGSTFPSLGLIADEPLTVRTSLRSIGIDVSIEEVRAGSPAATDNFNVVAYELGQTVDYSGELVAFFYTKTPANTEDSSRQEIQVPTPIASVNLNPEWEKTLLIWLGLGNGKYGVLAMPDNAFSFPQNHVRFVNLTPYRIGVMTTDKERQITLPKKDWIIDANGRDAIFFRAIMEKPDGKSKRLSNVVEMRPNVRRTVIFAISNAGEMGGTGEGTPQFAYFVYTEKQPDGS